MTGRNLESETRPERAPAKGGALDGIVVLELGMVMQVPLAGQMLGDYGADVIKIERPAPGDILRTLDPVGRDKGEMGCYYAALGRNKRTVCLDLKQHEAREVLLTLVERADVLLHNFRPGVMERLGFGYGDLEPRNPRLVYAAGFAFGESGPMAGMPGQDMLAQSFSGFAMSGLEDDEPPRISNTPVVDYTTAVSLTQGIMAALLERERSGRGQMVTTSLFDVALATQVLEISSRAIHGYRTSWIKQSMVFRTRDGWLTVLTLFRDNPLQMLCRAFDVEDLSREARFATTDLQVDNLGEIRDRFSPIVEKLTTDECVRRLFAVDLLCSPVNDLAAVIDHPQTRHNGTIWDVPVPGRGPVRLAGNPVRLSRTPAGIHREPSAIGAHSDEVLTSFGFSQDEIERLRTNGAVK